MAAFNGTNTFTRGTRVRVIYGEGAGNRGVVTTVGDNGNYTVQMETGNTIVKQHSQVEEYTVEEFGSSCSACGAAFNENDERAEVVNKTTGARSVVHVEEYLADTDCYDLA